MSRYPTSELIGEMVSFFLPYCEDKSTLNELIVMSKNYELWIQAHKLFDRIRDKTLTAHSNNDVHSLYQYSFEEICAKSLFNFSHSSAPFDEDSPFWVIPLGFQFAKFLGIEDPYSFTSLLNKNSENESGIV